MPQSLSNVLIHFVFSTKQRAPSLDDHWRQELHNMIVAITKRLGGQVVIVNSVKDHVHMLAPLPRTCTMANLMKEVKGETSEWIHNKFPGMRAFQWQGGYGAFSVSPSHRDDVVRYIASQEQHHQKVSFQEEFLRLLNLYKVDYNEAYLWD